MNKTKKKVKKKRNKISKQVLKKRIIVLGTLGVMVLSSVLSVVHILINL